LNEKRNRRKLLTASTHVLALATQQARGISPSLATRAFVMDVFPNADDYEKQEQRRKSK
jgi:hypothetical protein